MELPWDGAVNSPPLSPPYSSYHLAGWADIPPRNRGARLPSCLFWMHRDVLDQLEADSPMSHTYSSEAHSSLSTIDHILCSQHLLAKVTSTIQEDAQNTSDHIPIVASLSFLPKPTHSGMNTGAPMPSVSPRRNWEGTSKENLYSTPLQQSLQDLLQSSPTPPSTPSHLLTSLTSTLLSTSANIPSKSFHPFRSPGWTSEMKAACKDDFFVFGSMQEDPVTLTSQSLQPTKQQRKPSGKQ